jgi:non-ribosomal peptide synthetase component E (peptide arylation enzyme)
VTVGGPHCLIGYLRDDGSIERVRGTRIKSGDLAIMDEDGFVRVSGRSKDLIIRGGVNICPAGDRTRCCSSRPSASSMPPQVGVPRPDLR